MLMFEVMDRHGNTVFREDISEDLSPRGIEVNGVPTIARRCDYMPCDYDGKHATGEEYLTYVRSDLDDSYVFFWEPLYEGDEELSDSKIVRGEVKA